MKKILIILGSLVLLVTLSACGPNQSNITGKLSRNLTKVEQTVQSSTNIEKANLSNAHYKTEFIDDFDFDNNNIYTTESDDNSYLIRLGCSTQDCIDCNDNLVCVKDNILDSSSILREMLADLLAGKINLNNEQCEGLNTLCDSLNTQCSKINLSKGELNMEYNAVKRLASKEEPNISLLTSRYTRLTNCMNNRIAMFTTILNCLDGCCDTIIEGCENEELYNYYCNKCDLSGKNCNDDLDNLIPNKNSEKGIELSFKREYNNKNYNNKNDDKDVNQNQKTKERDYIQNNYNNEANNYQNYNGYGYAYGNGYGYDNGYYFPRNINTYRSYRNINTYNGNNISNTDTYKEIDTNIDTYGKQEKESHNTEKATNINDPNKIMPERQILEHPTETKRNISRDIEKYNDKKPTKESDQNVILMDENTDSKNNVVNNKDYQDKDIDGEEIDNTENDNDNRNYTFKELRQQKEGIDIKNRDEKDKQKTNIDDTRNYRPVRPITRPDNPNDTVRRPHYNENNQNNEQKEDYTETKRPSFKTSAIQ